MWVYKGQSQQNQFFQNVAGLRLEITLELKPIYAKL